jgi:hypothetical protein
MAKVTRSRDDLSACRVHAISYRITKGAEAMYFKRTSHQSVERSEGNPDRQKRVSGRRWELETDLNYELHDENQNLIEQSSEGPFTGI